LEGEGQYIGGDEDPVQEFGVEARYCGIEVGDAVRENSG